MIIYNPHNQSLLKSRVALANKLLEQVPAKYCFITGSFLFKETYNDIDIFVITRSKKEIKINHPKAKVTIIDFNDLHSLFFHSISKSCVAKNLLPTKPLKVTLSDYWQVINEAVPTLLNDKNKYHKNTRFLLLYTEYFKTGAVLDTCDLDQAIHSFKSVEVVLEYIKQTIPKMVLNKKPAYLKRFFYTKSGHYKEFLQYSAQQFLYNLCHSILGGAVYGKY